MPPRRGANRVLVIEELVALGHQLTPAWMSAIRLSPPRIDPLAPLANLLEVVASPAENFDVISARSRGGIALLQGLRQLQVVP